MPVKSIKLEEAIGLEVGHDMTKIVRGEFKGPAFRRGSVISTEDIDELRKMGKDNIYVLELTEGEVHEDEAITRLSRAACGHGINCTSPKEGKINFYAAHSGLFKINISALTALNEIDDVMFATIPNNTPVLKGEMVAGARFIPLVTKEEIVEAAEKACLTESGTAEGIIGVKAFLSLKAGIIVTGNEVFYGRIKDEFGPVLKQKVEELGSHVSALEYVKDDASDISKLIKKMAEDGAQLILLAGGMSVDPDDVTRNGIMLSGAKVEKYGAPVLPGAMFLLSYLGDIPVIGIPACGMYFRTTVLDLVLPRLLAGERLTKRDIISLAHGGLCRECSECRYPRCSFGLAGH